MAARMYLLAAVSALFVLLTATIAQAAVDAAMLRDPDVSQSHIVFVYDNDVWMVPKEGGVASPFSSPPGQELRPKFSPDGQTVAYSANYDGSLDVFTMPVGGGTPQQLAYHPFNDMVIDYTPDGRVVFMSWRASDYPAAQLYYADPAGGLPEKLPMAYAFFASFSDDGQTVAFAPWTREWDTWNRYQGGTATDLWLMNLGTLEAERITDFPGTDDMPMFHGDWVYYLSDGGPAHRRNIWRYNIDSREREQVTHFTDYEVKFPSIGPAEIVFEYDGSLYLLSLDDHSTHKVEVTIPGDHPNVRPQLTNVSDYIFDVGLSPQAKRLALCARGDIWTAPVEDGFKRNLTRSDGVAERNPSWSPDGKWIAYFSDESGEYQLCIRPGDGSGEPRQLTNHNKGFYLNPTWSPDSQKIAYSDQTGSYWICLIDTEENVFVGKDPWANDGIVVAWAPDSNWLAYVTFEEQTGNGIINLYDLENRTAHQVTSGMFSSYDPTFDLGGDFLYFVTDRAFQPVFSNVADWGEFYFVNTAILACAPLRADVEWPFAPKNDEEEVKDDSPDEDAADAGAAAADTAADQPEVAAADEDADAEVTDAGDEETADETGEEEEKEPERIEIEVETLEARTRRLPIEASNFLKLRGGERKLFYLDYGPDGVDTESTLMMFDLEEKEAAPVLDGVYGYALTPDASQMLVLTQGQFFVTAAAPGAALEAPVDTSGMLAQIDPRAEWRQIVTDAWRIYRDYFYDPHMHGVDWDAQLDRALDLLKHAANRDDVNYVLGLMVAELNVGHAYVYGFSDDQAARLPGGLLGCDFELAQDTEGHRGYRIAKIYDTPPWELEIKSPLKAPDVNVQAGEFLLAVNGIALDTVPSPYVALRNCAGKPTSLLISAKAVIDDTAREVLVEPISSEYELRHRTWMEANRRYVDEKSDGRIGYIYVRDTAEEGFADFMRQFMGQYRRDALIVDERWNGGGWSPHRMIELLARNETWQYWARRDGVSWRTPHQICAGPKAMLINYAAGSGGDSFPFMFRKAGIGPLIGSRTWGGLVGLSGNPSLIDGGICTVPSFGLYEADGTWAVEGYGVAPDIEVLEDPGLLAQGLDPQLDAAIEYLLDELEKHPVSDPPKPAYPDRSGMGVLESQK
ncbi:PD40 domain-containing protein [bacterium]|nr:PD40 domain-containing protein [bacterium]